MGMARDGPTNLAVEQPSGAFACLLIPCHAHWVLGAGCWVLAARRRFSGRPNLAPRTSHLPRPTIARSQSTGSSSLTPINSTRPTAWVVTLPPSKTLWQPQDGKRVRSLQQLSLCFLCSSVGLDAFALDHLAGKSQGSRTVEALSSAGRPDSSSASFFKPAHTASSKQSSTAPQPTHPLTIHIITSLHEHPLTSRQTPSAPVRQVQTHHKRGCRSVQGHHLWRAQHCRRGIDGERRRAGRVQRGLDVSVIVLLLTLCRRSSQIQ